MSTTTIFTTTRDQIALDVYLRALLLNTRHSQEECAKVAYQAADVFIAEQTRQNETPQLPDRKTVPPVVGKRFYTRSGSTVTVDSFSSHAGTYTVAATNPRRYVVDIIGQANDPANDLVSECPF